MKNFQPDEFQFHMCSCTYEIQPDEFSPRGWKSQFQLIENFHQNFTQKNFIWLKKFNPMKFIWLTQRKYQLLCTNFYQVLLEWVPRRIRWRWARYSSDAWSCRTWTGWPPACCLTTDNPGTWKETILPTKTADKKN